MQIGEFLVNKKMMKQWGDYLVNSEKEYEIYYVIEKESADINNTHHKKEYYWLQNGVTKDYMKEIDYYNKTIFGKVKLLCCLTKIERNFF